MLLVSNNYNDEHSLPKWGIPKGHLEQDESNEECAIRELYEEAGVKVNIPKDTKFMKVNNSKYYLFVDKTPSIIVPNPIDTQEIRDCKFIYQRNALGTGHAVRMFLKKKPQEKQSRFSLGLRSH